MRGFALALPLLAGCIDEFHGSNVQADFGPAMPVQASRYAGGVGAGELPSNVHFTLYAVSDGLDDVGNPVGNVFAVQDFEIHRIVDLQSPCFIDVGARVPFPGLHVSQYADMVGGQSGATDVDIGTAMQRQKNVMALAGEMGPKVVSSTSARSYPPIAADCSDPSGIPPPSCTDAASNKRRLDACQAAWKADPDYFEGTDRILTDPLDGTAHGMVDGINPVNFAPVGGAQFYVDESLDDFAAFAIYYQQDGAPADQLGTQLLYGHPEKPTRGVIRVHMTSLVSAALTADLAIFSDVDDDEVHF